MRREQELTKQRMVTSAGVQKGVIYFSIILLLGTVLRLYDLGDESFWFDEIYTVHRISQDFQTLSHQLISQPDMTRNALYYLIAHFWVLPFKMSEVAVRSLSVLFGVLSIVLLYMVGRLLFSEKVALLSSLLMAVSEFQIQHSQEARFYSMLVLLTLVSIYCYVLAYRKKRWGIWVISGLVNILLFYTHTYGVFIFGVQYIHYLLYWRSNRSTWIQWVLSQILLVLGVIGGSLTLLADGRVAGLGGGLAWITEPSLKDLFLTIYSYLFPQNYLHTWLFIAASFLTGAFFLVLVVAFQVYRNGMRQWVVTLQDSLRPIWRSPITNSETLLVVIWFVVPILLPFVYSNFFPPIFVDRYTICAAPAFYLLTAMILSRLNRVIPIYASLIALMIVILPGLQDYYAADINEQWREVAAYVQENGQPNDVIVFAPDDNGYQHRSFDWYYSGSLPNCGVSSNIKDEQTIDKIISDCTHGYDRVWVIIRGPSEAIDRFSSYFLRPNHVTDGIVSKRQFVKVDVYLFGLAK